MNVAASSRGMRSFVESPYSLRPYSTPKLNTFARRRCSDVTSSSGTPNTFAAVAAWMSSSFWNASISAGSWLRCAMIRSSICE